MRTKTGMALLDRKVGCLVGAAVGDALGMPTESVTPAEHLKYFNGRIEEYQHAPPGHPCAHLEKGQWTDDTQQMLVLAKSLRDNHRQFNLHDFAQRLTAWYETQTDKKEWRFPGGSSLAAGRRLKEGVSPLESGSKHSLSCGSVMRVAPVGICYPDPDDARVAGMQSSVVTHSSDICQESAGAVAEIVSHLIHRDLTIGQSVRYAIKNTPNKLVRDALSKAYRLKDEPPESAAKELGTDSSALSTMGYAVYCALHSPDFKEAIVTAANAVPGDTDSIACVAGAISGAYHGYRKIPRAYTKELENSRHIIQVARSL